MKGKTLGQSRVQAGAPVVRRPVVRSQTASASGVQSTGVVCDSGLAADTVKSAGVEEARVSADHLRNIVEGGAHSYQPSSRLASWARGIAAMIVISAGLVFSIASSGRHTSSSSTVKTSSPTCTDEMPQWMRDDFEAEQKACTDQGSTPSVKIHKESCPDGGYTNWSYNVSCSKTTIRFGQ